MSPAGLCEVAGNAQNPGESIIMSKTRQTLAKFEASVRTHARSSKSDFNAADLIVNATSKSVNRCAPEIGSFVTLFMSRDSRGDGAQSSQSGPDLLKEVLQSREEQDTMQDVQVQEPTVEAQIGSDKQVLEKDIRTKSDMATTLWQQLPGDSLAEGTELKPGALYKGIVLSRSTDGWYQVLLVQVFR